MDDQQQELYSRIAHFAFDEGDETLTFAARLARENAWSSAFAARAIAEYRRFVWLGADGGPRGNAIRRRRSVWHLHLTYTRSYWDRFCADTRTTATPRATKEASESRARRTIRAHAGHYREFFAEEARGCLARGDDSLW